MQCIGFIGEGSMGEFKGYGLGVEVGEVEVGKGGRIVWYLE